MSGQKRSGHGFGFDAQRRYFIAKTREFLERLRSCEFLGREDYEGQIERALQELEHSLTKEESERIVNEICLKVAIACYALKACERAKRHKKPERGDG